MIDAPGRTQPRHLVGLSLLLAGLLALVLGFARTAGAQDAAFEITLHGGNEVPPIASDATGTVAVQFTGDAVDFSLSASGATFTAAHIHTGGSGENGDVVAFLFSNEDGTDTVDASGTITEADLVGPFEGDWDAFAAALATGNTYANVHSQANPAGELRAQILPVWGTQLSADAQTADVDSDATGVFSMRAGAAGASWLLDVSGGTEMFTMGHIHLGPAGEDGPVVVPLFDSSGDPQASVSLQDTFAPEDIVGDLAGDYDGLVAALVSGELYVNVHSEQYPPGEVRGQVMHTSNVADEPETPEPTATPTTEPTATPEDTATPEPTATPTEVPATATPTREAPGAPDTGSGLSGGGTDGSGLFLVAASLAVAGAGLVTLAATRRRSRA